VGEVEALRPSGRPSGIGCEACEEGSVEMDGLGDNS